MLFERGGDDSVRAVPQRKTSVSAPQRPALVLNVQGGRVRRCVFIYPSSPHRDERPDTLAMKEFAFSVFLESSAITVPL
jgi:hypothetical protein